jgi:hypothetical protein
MRKTIILLAAFVLGLLTSLLVGVQTVEAQQTTDGEYCPLVSPISIISPSNSTYSSSVLTLNITVRTLLGPSRTNITMVYSVDGKNNATIPVSAMFVPLTATRTYENGTTENVTSIFSYYVITGSAALPELPEGPHNITVYAEYQYAGINRNRNLTVLDSGTVYFTINDGNTPIISNLSLENKTYQNSLPLNFTTDESTSWIGYCLDGKANVTIAGNTTLTILSDGKHNITVYATDLAGNTGASETSHFSVEVPKPFPTTLVAASVTSVAAVGTGLLVYFKKCTH